MKQHQTKQYTAYALGEIILVVLGILIALEVNNWNDRRKYAAEAMVFIEDLQADLQRDTAIFGREIRKIEKLIDYQKWGLQTEDFSEIPVDYIQGLFITQYHNLKVNNNTFQRLKNAEVFTLRQYQGLFQQVNTYYTFHQEYLDNFNDWETEMHRDSYQFWVEQGQYEIDFGERLQDTISIQQDPAERKQQMVQRLQSVEGRNYLKAGLMREKTMKAIYQRVYQKAIDILGQIEAELREEWKPK